ncbi:MAG: hypothetical protein K8R76_05720, partial [Candidatus Aegiribacteria sp.]|nr:hypothetical protein [Candidatus Aegiribacteria sp.]
PRGLQVYLRRVRAKRIFKEIGNTRIRSIISEDKSNFEWPGKYTAAVMITHDVETAKGQKNIRKLIKIERDKRITSCWNFVTDRYDVDTTLISELKTSGHEIGVHGVYHDGKLFSSRAVFQKRLPAIRDAAEKWGATGFRSPSLLYKTNLLRELPFSWDSSIPAWDPFQPQPGGCRCYYPFKLSDACVELPVTLWQDFTLFEELCESGIDIWKAQIDDIYKIGGLINVIVHPDYMNEQRLSMYDELLEHLQSKQQLWFALPSGISRWILEKN